MHVGAVLQAIRNHLTKAVVGESFVCAVGIVRLDDALVCVAGMAGHFPALIRYRGDVMSITSRVGVADGGTVRMSDLLDFTNAIRRRRTAKISGGVIIRVGEGIDEPIGIVTQVSGVSLKIGVIEEKLRGSGTGDVWTGAALVIVKVTQVRVSERPGGTIAARLVEDLRLAGCP